MRLGRSRLAGLAALLLLGTLLAGGIRRVPPGFVGLRGARMLDPGWHARAPFAPIPLFPASGELTIDDLSLRTREGSVLVFRLDLAYRLGARVALPLAADLRRGGMPTAVATLARRVLDEAAERADPESLLSSSSLIEAPLRIGLENSGVGVSRLSFRSPLGDELTRRRESERARALSRSPSGPVLVIGWDGADWDSIEPLVASGRMPNLSKLLAGGAHGDLRSYDPMFSPLLWTTVVTGKAPTEHGIADFVVKDARTDSRRMITSDFRKVKALWNVFTDFGRPSGWIAWWASYPAEPIDGVLVSDLLASSLLSGGPDRAATTANVATPAEFLAQRKALLSQVRTVSREDVERYFPVPASEWTAALDELSHPKSQAKRKPGEEDDQNPAAFTARTLTATRVYHALAKDLVRSGTPFVAVYYEAVDMMGHRFQHFRPPKMNMVKERDYERFRDAVSRWYEYQDELLGDLLRDTRNDTTVVILSDHGFLTGSKRPEGILPYTSVQPAEWHRDWGIVVLHGPHIRRGRIPAASIYDLAPTLLYLAGLPLAEDMPGRLIASAFTSEALRASPPRTIRSYELAGAPLAHGSGTVVDTAAMEEMMANLRALGYVGGEPASDPQPGPDESKSEGADTQVYYHRNLAVSYIKQGRFREAEAELQAANQRKPLGKTYSMLSEVRASQGRFDDAAAALEEGWKTAPETMDPSSILWIVDLHLLAGDRGGGERAAARWASTTSPAVKLAVDGRLAEAEGDLERATARYREALGEDPLIVRVAQRLQEIEARRGRPAAMEPFLVATLQAHPQVDAYWDLAGQIAMVRGDVSGAVERFHKAMELQPENGLYVGHFASASAASGDVEKAREALAWAERFPPRDGEGWMAVGSAWDRLGETDRAVAAFQAAGRSGMTGPGADLGAALALARAGRSDEARRVLDDVARRFPDNPAVRELRTRLQ